MLRVRSPMVVMLASALACGPDKPAVTSAGETTGAATTSGSSTGADDGTTGTAATTGAPTSSGTGSTGGPVEGVWRGELLQSFGGPLLVDCASGQAFQLLTTELICVSGEDDVFVAVAGLLHPDNPDDWDDSLEIEVTQFVVGPCQLGGCDVDEWSECVAFADLCEGWKQCDQWTQDCPEGEKCAPYSSDGDDTLDSLKCVPVMPGAGGEGDPCTVEGDGVSGIDSCAKGHVCWGVDPETLMGTCVAQCTGAPDNPGCPDPCTSCLIGDEGVLTICLAGCDPLAQDCPDLDLCVENPMSPDSFICVIDASGEEGQLFDACELPNGCDAGLWCAPPAMAGECDQQAAGCCLPFCDLSMPSCPGAGQQCLPWSNDPPVCPESVGVCRLP